MLSLRDPKLLEASAAAEQSFRRLHRANIVCYALLGVLALLGIWNVLVMSSVIRGEVPDLADAGSILTHISTKLIWWIALATLLLFIFKEWRWGERGFASIFFLAALLFLTLVPTMSAEVEPVQENFTLEMTYARCEQGGIEGEMLLDADKCDIVTFGEGGAFLSKSDPGVGDGDWLAPAEIQRGFAKWNVEARGRFKVHFILPQSSMDYCETSRLVTSVPSNNRYGHHCLEQDGDVWLVVPFETSVVESGYITIYQESAP